MSGRLFGYARVSVASDADANNLDNQRRVLADCEQVFEDVGSGASWNRPGLNCLKGTLQPGDCVKVAALDRLGRSLWGGRCCTCPSYSQRWSAIWLVREHWRDWSESEQPASTSDGARGSAGSGPKRYRTCACAMDYRGAASPP